MLRFEELAPLLGGRSQVDVPCPACSPQRKLKNRKLPVLRIWAVDAGMVSYYCAHCEESGYARDDEDDRGSPRDKRRESELKARAVKRSLHEIESQELRTARARQLWYEASAITGTWAERYLLDRGLDPAARYGAKGLRFHRHCPFPDGKSMPALLVAFTRLVDMGGHPDNFLADAEPIAIHRIRGRGHANKAMLGPVGKAAMMLDSPHLITSALSVTEGVETALAVRAFKEPGYPVFALGSSGAMERFPLIQRVQRLVIWADNDKSQVGLEAAKALARRYADNGRNAIIRMPEAGDYAE